MIVDVEIAPKYNQEYFNTQYISSLNFASLPFRPKSNFTNTPDTVPSGWATGHCVLGWCTFKGGVNVRVYPQEHPIATHHPSTEPNPLGLSQTDPISCLQPTKLTY